MSNMTNTAAAADDDEGFTPVYVDPLAPEPKPRLKPNPAAATAARRLSGNKKPEGVPHPLYETFRGVKPEDIDEAAFLVDARAFLVDAAGRPCRLRENCIECRCLRDIDAPPMLEQAARFVYEHARRTKAERQVAVKEWMRQAEFVKGERPKEQKKAPCFPLAGVYRSSNGGGDEGSDGDDKKKTNKKKEVASKTPYFVCRHALARLCNLGYHQWMSLKRDIDNRAPLRHGLQGRAPNSSTTKSTLDCKAAIAAFLCTIQNDPDLSGKSMRGLYELFCYRRGYVVRRDKYGGYGRIEDYEVREFDNGDWLEGSKPLPVSSKEVFDQIYNDTFPDAKEQRKRELAKAEEERKKRLKTLERQLNVALRDTERERMERCREREEHAIQMEREREQHGKEREMLLEEIAQLKSRLARLEGSHW